MNLPFGQQSGSTIGAHFHDKIQVVNSKAKAYCLGRGRLLTVLVARMRLPTIDEIPTFSISHALIQPWQKNNDMHPEPSLKHPVLEYVCLSKHKTIL